MDPCVRVRDDTLHTVVRGGCVALLTNQLTLNPVEYRALCARSRRVSFVNGEMHVNVRIDCVKTTHYRLLLLMTITSCHQVSLFLPPLPAIVFLHLITSSRIARQIRPAASLIRQLNNGLPSARHRKARHLCTPCRVPSHRVPERVRDTRS